MSLVQSRTASRRLCHSALAALSGFVLLVPLTGCIVAGYSSGSGFWMWPGSIVLTLVLILFYFLTRHR